MGNAQLGDCTSQHVNFNMMNKGEGACSQSQEYLQLLHKVMKGEIGPSSFTLKEQQKMNFIIAKETQMKEVNARKNFGRENVKKRDKGNEKNIDCEVEDREEQNILDGNDGVDPYVIDWRSMEKMPQIDENQLEDEEDANKRVCAN